MTHKCPGCGKEFEEVKLVVSSSPEPYTAIALAPLDLMAVNSRLMVVRMASLL